MDSTAEVIKRSELSVLIVEDDEIYGLRLIHWIKDICSKVELAKSAEHGIFYVTSMDPDVIFLDHNLPRQSGKDVLELYRELSPKSHIYMMTGADIKPLLKEAIEHGAHQFLDKKGLQKSIVHGLLLEVAGSKLKNQ